MSPTTIGVVTSNGTASMPSRSAVVEGLASARTAEATQRSASQPTVIRRVGAVGRPADPRASAAEARLGWARLGLSRSARPVLDRQTVHPCERPGGGVLLLDGREHE